ncbi:GGDEF domain-containing protein [Marinobacterium litorale]|uniref:GGDEF domain-containing protein n=1 Tax=Marinobacterium litorale TaxID=404770 RepID=UPI000409A14B|nr:GGDEF domain-containing protein [Marinobacterium litorale]
MPKLTSLSRSLNTALFRAVLVALLILVGISLVAYKGAIEKQIYRDSQFISELVFSRFFTLMSQGAPADTIQHELEQLYDEDLDVSYEVLRSNLVSRQFGGEAELTERQTLQLRQHDFFQHSGMKLTYLRPLLFDERCLQCHIGIESGELAGALAITSPIPSLKLPFRYLIWGVAMIVALTLVSTLLILSHHARRHIIHPVERISGKMKQINDHTDLAEMKRDSWPIQEFDSLEAAFHSQHKKLLNAYQALQQRAELDPLTGAYNRFRFDDLLENALARAQRQQEPLSLVMLDLDHFKQINDAQGHNVGDMVLKRLARQLSKVIRSTDHLVRLGGDEFLLITEGCTRGQTSTLFERLRESLDVAEANNPIGCHIEFSVGVAEYPLDTTSKQELIKTADGRMYAHKLSRRAQRGA